MEGTFIKLDRKILRWEWFEDSKMFHLFIYLLLRANHKDGKWQGIDVKRGQLLVGRSKLSLRLNLSEMQVRTCLKKLKKTNEITIHPTNRNSLITICKYDTYQSKKETYNQQNNLQTTTEITNSPSTFIKLDRKILKWEWFNDEKMVHLFVYLLLMANYSDGTWQGIEVKRGQVLTKRLELALALNLSEMQIKTCLKKLKITNEITINATNRNSLITICKYDTYQTKKELYNQKLTQPQDQQIANKYPTDNQQITTNKNNKEYKNEKNEKEFTTKGNTAVGGQNDFDINFLLNPPNFPTWRKEVSEFLADDYFIQQFVKNKKLKYAEVVGLMREFVTDLNLNGKFKKVDGLKVHFNNRYEKRLKDGLIVKNSGSLSSGYVEMPSDFDYESENVVKW